jgi:hypothetical protein
MYSNIGEKENFESIYGIYQDMCDFLQFLETADFFWSHILKLSIPNTVIWNNNNLISNFAKFEVHTLINKYIWL